MTVSSPVSFVMDTPLRCLIVDDDDVSRALIEHYVSQHEGLVLVASCPSAIEAANALQREAIDLVFLDVEMPEMSGLDLLKSLHERPQIILVTSKERYALEAFDIGVTDYLHKPVSYARFLKAVQRACRQAEEATPTTPTGPQENHVFIKTGERLVKLDLTAVQWIEAQSDYMLIHTDTESHLIHSTMKKLEDQLPASDFARVHRSFIIRIDQIEDIENTTLVIGRKVVPIGASYKEKLFQRLKTL